MIAVSKCSKANVITPIDVILESGKVELLSNRPFTEYDRSVYDAITSLHVSGDGSNVFTPAQIYHAMTNTTNDPSAQQIDEVNKSIKKMSLTRIKIDCIEDYLLSVETLTVTLSNGKEQIIYHLSEPPALYRYSSMLSICDGTGARVADRQGGS